MSDYKTIKNLRNVNSYYSSQKSLQEPNESSRKKVPLGVRINEPKLLKVPLGVRINEPKLLKIPFRSLPKLKASVNNYGFNMSPPHGITPTMLTTIPACPVGSLCNDAVLPNSTIYFGSQLPDGTFNPDKTINRYYTETTGFPCGNSTFFNVGDIDPGVYKRCGYKNEPPPDFSKITKCAGDGELCNLPNDSMIYMRSMDDDPNKIVGRHIGIANPVVCSTSLFFGANPDPGKPKQCGYVSPNNTAVCANDGGVCRNLPLTPSELIYGTDTNYISRVVANESVDCNGVLTFFGADPSPGVFKKCKTKSVIDNPGYLIPFDSNGQYNVPPNSRMLYIEGAMTVDPKNIIYQNSLIKDNIPGGLTTCNSSTFYGANIAGAPAKCYFSTPLSSNIAPCTSKGGICGEVPPNKQVYMYEKNSKKVTNIFTTTPTNYGNVSCDSAYFGPDPSPGVDKLCGFETSLPVYTVNCGAKNTTCTNVPVGRTVYMYENDSKKVTNMYTPFTSGSFLCGDVNLFGVDPNTSINKTCAYTPPHLMCGAHGTLTSTGTCTCRDGYTGDDCSVPPLNCGAHGTLAANGTCTCKDGYTGNTCSVPPLNCGAHGTLATNGTCTCRDGYTGNTCSVAPPDCGIHGLLNGTTCTCKEGYTGNTCTIPPPPSIDCGLHGILAANGTCTCKDGYTGNTCTIPPSPSTDCGVHGILSANGTCTCRDGYTGNTCTVPPSPDVPPVTPPSPPSSTDCGVHGILTATGSCFCKDGYTGNNCTIPSSSPNVPPSTPPSSGDCGEHGILSSTGTCICKDNYLGDKCNISPLALYGGVGVFFFFIILCCCMSLIVMK